MSNTSRLKKLTGQKDVKDIKAKADGPGNLKSRRAMKDVKDIKA